jgi:hypothetical protein
MITEKQVSEIEPGKRFLHDGSEFLMLNQDTARVVIVEGMKSVVKMSSGRVWLMGDLQKVVKIEDSW